MLLSFIMYWASSRLSKWPSRSRSAPSKMRSAGCWGPNHLCQKLTTSQNPYRIHVALWSPVFQLFFQPQVIAKSTILLLYWLATSICNFLQHLPCLLLRMKHLCCGTCSLAWIIPMFPPTEMFNSISLIRNPGVWHNKTCDLPQWTHHFAEPKIQTQTWHKISVSKALLGCVAAATMPTPATKEALCFASHDFSSASKNFGNPKFKGD